MSKSIELGNQQANKIWKSLRQVRSKQPVPRDNHCEVAHYGKYSISIFQNFFASTDTIFISGEGLTLGKTSMKFWDFLVFPNFLRS